MVLIDREEGEKNIMLLLLSQMERTQSVYQAWCDKYSMLRSKFRQQPIR